MRSVRLLLVPAMVAVSLALAVPAAARPAAHGGHGSDGSSGFQWPVYGYSPSRGRDFWGERFLAPPFKLCWAVAHFAQLEFSPVIAGDDLYLMDNSSRVEAFDKLTGQRLWERKLGRLAAASPALDTREGLLFVPLLSDHRRSPGGGSLYALSMRTGQIVWSRQLRAGSESSPIVSHGSVYFGDQGGTVWNLDAATGTVHWKFRARRAVKGGLALVGSRLFFGDYSGRAYAVNARTARKVWSTYVGGSFYATPAVAFGRVFMGNTDGSVYAFGAEHGRLAWRAATHSYVYASAAVASVPGLGPTVYVGSYDGSLYALSARTGRLRWKHASGGRISGSATIIDNVVYYSVLGSKTTLGLNARTGHQVFFFPDGEFNGVVADPGAIYLIGASTLYRLVPKNPPPPGHHHRGGGHHPGSHHHSGNRTHHHSGHSHSHHHRGSHHRGGSHHHGGRLG